jgi:RND family efflux transporter MFP subunit
MQLLTLEGGVATSKRKLLQVQRDNEAFLEQAKAASEEADAALLKEQERLTRYRKQVENTKIYAPQAGMVAYAVSDNPWRRHEEIREGAAVRPRQHILSLPNLSRMQVKTTVHESVLDQISVGLPVTIRVDAFPDRSYQGSVETVAVLAEQGSETKVYATTITIDEEVEQLKPGMTAVVEIHVKQLRDILSVPVQAIEQVGRDNWCYVQSGRNVERRTVKLGRTNDRYVEIIEGLDEGDRVVLNPMAIIDETRNSAKESAKQSAAEKSEKKTQRPTKQLPSAQPPAAARQRQRKQPDARGTPGGPQQRRRGSPGDGGPRQRRSS